MRWLSSVLAVFSVCLIGSAAILRVGPGNEQQFTSLPAAVAAASANDTIYIGPSADSYGIGYEDMILTYPLHFIGAGWPNASTPGTTINLSQHRIRLRSLASGSSFESIAFYSPPCQNNASDTMVAAIALDSLTSSVSLRRVMCPCPGTNYYSCYKSIALLCQGGNASIYVDDCVFYGDNPYNGGCAYGIVCSGAGSVIVVAHTFFGSLGGALSISAPADVSLVNCIVWNSSLYWGGETSGMMNNVILWSSSVSLPGNITMSYNAGNGSVVGSDWLSISTPPFVNFPDGSRWLPNTYDLHLAPGSPCIDAGVPNQTDRDGSRVDLGIYGGQSPFVDSGIPDFPVVTSLSIPAVVPQNGVLPIYSTGRVGPGQ